jgi:pseudouridine-5'-phosphate glycosidase
LGVEIRAEVAEALGTGAPVVALESTLISHGLPRPDNLSVAREAERTVRAEGAIPATVGVVGFRTERFPGFYLTDSGSPLDWAVEDEGEAARLIRALPELGFERSGLVVANPIPEGEQLDPELHDRTLRAGLEELRRRGVRGKEVTPFFLDYFGRETKEESLRVNNKIILQNARLAVALSALDGAER